MRIPRKYVFTLGVCSSFSRAALLAALLYAGGCAKYPEPEGHDHDHGSPSGGKEEHDEHEGHGHETAESGHDEHVDEVTLTPEAIEQYGVRESAAEAVVLRPTIVAPARVAFNTEAMAHVGSPLRGRAVEVKVRLGDSVSAGQELVVIESPELGEAQVELLQKKTAVLTAVPAAELAKISWERAQTLYEQSQGISLTEVQRREAEYKAALADVKAAEAAAMASENRLQLLGMTQDDVATLANTGEVVPRYAIRAAIEGQVVEREITLGELVGPDREELLILADTRTLWVLADVPERSIMGIAVGARAWASIGSATDEVAESGTSRIEGTVSFISPLVDMATRTAQVRLEVPASMKRVGEAAGLGGGTLRPGMFAQAEIVVAAPGGATSEAVIAVPDEAIQIVEGSPAVFVPVAGESNTFARRVVQIGKKIGGMVPIHAGLQEGERYVSAGTFILKAELGKGSAAHEH